MMRQSVHLCDRHGRVSEEEEEEKEEKGYH